MKSTILVLFAVMLFTACNHALVLHLSNQSDIDLVNKPLELERLDLETLLGPLSETEVAMLTDEDGNRFPAQTEDRDGDGKWDLLYTQVSLPANATRHFSFNFAEGPGKTLTNIRFADINDPSREFESAERLTSNDTEISQQYFQFEGPGWENDVVAFRNYFDARNGIDIFGKTSREMVLDSCGLKGGPSYHELQAWGMDILKVANSLGAGAIALVSESGLHRIGPGAAGTYTLVHEGPLRSVFDLDFKGMKVNDQTVNVKHRITIEAGKPYYKSEIWLENGRNLQLAAGIVNLDSDTFYVRSNDNFSYFFTHDNQAYDGEKLGMALFVPANQLLVHTAPEEGEGITQTFYTVLPAAEQPVTFYFMAGWEKQNVNYSSLEGFEKAILHEIQMLEGIIVAE
ncbi:MAG: DUF4861 family protein [Prolixibacteraceae bacterium]|nr:DUF4861 family protein [Prolixibacteraceae bacterium]